MKKYAKVINEETKLCEVGLGTNKAFYQSIGMTELEVEQAYDGNWYVLGFAPVKPEPTIEEQNEEIRATRESLYRATSDYLKADYDEAVARGADNVEELKQKWLESKDKIRAENPYVVEEGEEVPTEDAALPIEESKIETSMEEPETPVPSSSVSLEDAINSVLEK